jgi:predicted dehydrogenase
MVNVGVIGCGSWGSNLIRNFHELPQANLIACSDVDQGRLDYIKHLYPNVKVFSNYEGILAEEGLQGVAIATPAGTHYELARKLLERGQDVLVEKPMTLSTEQAQDLIQLAQSRGRILMVGHVFIYNPAVVRLREYIQQGELGDIYYLYSTRVNLGRVRTDLNAMWNFAPHDISIMMYLLDEEPISVSAQGVSYLQDGIQDVVFMTLYFSRKRTGHIHVSWLDPSKKRTMTVVGSKKMIIYDDVDNEAKLKIYDKGVYLDEAVVSFGEFQFRLHYGDISIPKLDLKEPVKQECAHFIDCIQTRRPPITDGYNGLKVVQVLEAGQRSLENSGQVTEVVRE